MRFLILGLLSTLVITGCGNPRTRDEIFAERESLPQVYVGLKSQKQITAPARKGVFVDPDTKDEFWPAIECLNPECPARQGSDPVLFAVPRAEVNRGCPHCLKVRDLKTETPEQKAKFAAFAAPYVLPETKARNKQLDAEFQRAADRK